MCSVRRFFLVGVSSCQACLPSEASTPPLWSALLSCNGAWLLQDVFHSWLQTGFHQWQALLKGWRAGVGKAEWLHCSSLKRIFCSGTDPSVVHFLLDEWEMVSASSTWMRSWARVICRSPCPSRVGVADNFCCCLRPLSCLGWFLPCTDWARALPQALPELWGQVPPHWDSWGWVRWVRHPPALRFMLYVVCAAPIDYVRSSFLWEVC